MKDKKPYWIYILLCTNNNFYTGYTDNILNRYHLHITGRAKSKYTKSFKPVKVVQCFRVFDTKGMALKIEHFIKKLTRQQKEIIVSYPDKLITWAETKYKKSLKLYYFNPALIHKEYKAIQKKDTKIKDPFKTPASN